MAELPAASAALDPVASRAGFADPPTQRGGAGALHRSGDRSAATGCLGAQSDGCRAVGAMDRVSGRTRRFPEPGGRGIYSQSDGGAQRSLPIPRSAIRCAVNSPTSGPRVRSLRAGRASTNRPPACAGLAVRAWRVRSRSRRGSVTSCPGTCSDCSAPTRVATVIDSLRIALAATHARSSQPTDSWPLTSLFLRQPLARSRACPSIGLIAPGPSQIS